MGQKINPKSFRLGVVENWDSRWLSLKYFKEYLEEDEAIRVLVRKRLHNAGIDNISIERSGQKVRVIIKAARPGLVIGRSGKGVDDLRMDIEKALNKIKKRHGMDQSLTLNVDVDEVMRTDISASVVAQDIAASIERRRKFRRVLKQEMEKVIQNKKVQGVKIKISGRLNGVEIARSEWMSEGKIPLHTLRANIDYGVATAFCTYGAIGIKVWIYKGEVFDK